MKKIFCFIISLFVISSHVMALEISPSDVENGTYIIGNYMFNRNSGTNYDGVLTTKHIMLSSKSIDSKDLSDMKIYYKNSRGKWVDPLTNNEVVLENDKFEIIYINNEVDKNIISYEQFY